MELKVGKVLLFIEIHLVQHQLEREHQREHQLILQVQV